MKAGDLVKHKHTDRTAVIINIFMRESHCLEYRHEEYVKVLFSGEHAPSTAPLQLLKKNWEIINEI